MTDSHAINSPTPSDPWLRAYTQTFIYHDQTVEALKNLEIRVWHLTCAIEALSNIMQVLLVRSRGDGLFGGSAKRQAESMVRPSEKTKLPKKQKNKRIEVEL